MSTRNAHYMNACKEMTIWNVSANVAAKNDWNGKRQNYFAFNDFIPKDVLQDILKCQEDLSN
ncbi:hypothetical protein AM233_21515 [Bacillus sp. FJAT-22058]|nr:hypothetical protein AM233_21515 [Bacillus sp. FJAT-22058]